MKVYYDEENKTIINVEQIQSVKPSIAGSVEVQLKCTKAVYLHYKKREGVENAIKTLYALMLEVESAQKEERNNAKK